MIDADGGITVRAALPTAPNGVRNNDRSCDDEPIMALPEKATDFSHGRESSRGTILGVIGDPLFLHRHRGLIEHLGSADMTVRPLPLPEQAAAVLRIAHLGARRLETSGRIDFAFQKNAAVFRSRSRRAERAVRAAGEVDAVLQIFGGFRTYDVAPRLPAFHLVDYTMLLAARHWPPWAYFPSAAARARWTDLEGASYRSARHLFAMSAVVADSLVEDYAVARDRISVIGSAPSVAAASPGPKPVGTGSLLFNGSDFLRKGGDLAVGAMVAIRRAHPGARLTVIGNRHRVRADGVDDLGVVREPGVVARLLHEADLVVAPARCDPFPTFLVEAQRAGVPVVTSARDGMSEIVEDGRTGRLLAVPTVSALADAVTGLLADPALLRAMSDAAVARSGTLFDWRVIAPVVRSIMRESLVESSENGFDRMA